ncbi:MAG: hypothetical protein ACKVQV_11170 [Bacteroidia bacterium]
MIKGIIVFFLFLLAVPAKASSNFKADTISQDSVVVSKKLGIGIHLSYHYNFPVLHTTPALVFTIKNNAFIAGPCLTRIKSNAIVYAVATIEQESNGAMLGYMYTFDQVKGLIVPFFQTFFYGYEAYTLEYSHMYKATHTRLVIENTAGFGAKIKGHKNFEIQFGAGIGSTNGFFLIIDQFVPHAFVGLQYRFR